MGAWDEGECRIFMHDREQSGAVSGRDERRLRDGAWSGVIWRVVCGVSCRRWRGNGRACCIFRRKQSGLCARVLCLSACATPSSGLITACFTFLRPAFTLVFLAQHPTYPTAHSAPLCLSWAVSRISTASPLSRIASHPHLSSLLPLSSLRSSSAAFIGSPVRTTWLLCLF
jgi:hypothetical protein